MSYPELNQLTSAEQLFDEGKLAKALEIFNDRSQFEGLNPQQKYYYQFLKGLILLYQNKSEEVIELGEDIFKDAQKHNNKLQSFDGLFFIIFGFCIGEKFNEAFKLIEKAEDYLRLIANLPKIIFTKREARLNLLKGEIHTNLNNIDVAEKCAELVLNSQKIIGDTFEIAWAYMEMIQIMFLVKGRFDIAIEYLKKLMSLAKEIKFNHYWIAVYHGFFWDDL